VLIALNQLASKPEESLMIGDTKFDILCARNAGVTSVLVSWALAMSEEDRTGVYQPEHILEKAEDLFLLL
jgi:pyrophosphatase PpaX